MWKYYVYELADPRTGLAFYVGKGSGDRIDEHERETARGVSSKKCNKIRKLKASGQHIEKRKIAYFMDEQDAYGFEEERIKFYGKPNLTNVAPFTGDEPVKAENVWLSEPAMRALALVIRAKAGYVIDEEARPFAAALQRVCVSRFNEIFEKALVAVGFQSLRDGLKPFGINLRYGG